MDSLTNRIIRAGKLDHELYREVKEDPEALGPALNVVLLSSLAAGIGSLQLGIIGFVTGTAAAFAGWLVWTLIIYLVGSKILPEARTRTSLPQLLRVAGFASAPGILRLLAGIPYLGGLVIFAASLWMLTAMIIATRQALDYESAWRAAGVCLLGWILQGMAIAPFLLMMSAKM
ncbi:YIP1 family protein [Desulfurivibrio alkaliphilus]|uniref:Yip1 domain-containing protein n=1 Tax=Desulfurivibrio alkaliphilus (strain DSM 19089 / UNIQEM U267 / AHT2) TaxID=589865 RepID=D6Z3Y3_DESAT|nr:YIP1 family protein [Desulfurivibrio alkaliphilus]ADH86258.1 membrane protein of unknown function (DUF1430) [Desulfurivibrio alkaliphilus AHT 2]